MMLQRLMNEWPFALGEGPYRISGLVYQGQKKAYAKRWKGGHQEVIALLRAHDQAYADFFDQTFLSTRQYDLFGIVAVSAVLSRAVGQTHHDFIYEYSKRQFEIDTGGLYRIVLRLTSPSRIFQTLVDSELYYYNFAPLAMAELRPNGVKCVKKGFPILLSGWYDIVVHAYTDVTMARCGVKDYHLSIEKEPTGEFVETVELCNYHIEVNWT